MLRTFQCSDTLAHMQVPKAKEGDQSTGAEETHANGSDRNVKP